MVDPELDPTSALAALMAANRRTALQAAEPTPGARAARGPSLAVVGWLDANGDTASAHAALEVFGSLGTRVLSIGGGADGASFVRPLIERVGQAVGEGGTPLLVVLASKGADAEARVFEAIEAVLGAGGENAARVARRELRIVGGIVERSVVWPTTVDAAASIAGTDSARLQGAVLPRIRWLGEHARQAEILARGPRRGAR